MDHLIKKHLIHPIRIYDYKVRAIGSNISLDRFYSNIDPVSVINDLIRYK